MSITWNEDWTITSRIKTSVPAAVGSGAIEMGVASLTRYVGDIPAVDIFYQPFLFDSEAKVRAAVAKGSPVRGPLDEAIAGTGSTVLWWQAYGGAIMLSKGGPVKTPADMKGKKVTIIHEELKNLDMPAMTMVFRVADDAMLEKVQEGQEIEFSADRINGNLTVIELKE